MFLNPAKNISYFNKILIQFNSYVECFEMLFGLHVLMKIFNDFCFGTRMIFSIYGLFFSIRQSPHSLRMHNFVIGMFNNLAIIHFFIFLMTFINRVNRHEADVPHRK